MKRKVGIMFLCMILICTVFPVTAMADMGPKPSVQIHFIGIEGQTYYATLLSKKESTGPASHWKQSSTHGSCLSAVKLL